MLPNKYDDDDDIDDDDDDDDDDGLVFYISFNISRMEGQGLLCSTYYTTSIDCVSRQ